jgi:hypothetical protein
MDPVAEPKYRISGHESFACRYAWLPKAARGLGANPELFSDDEKAMVDLGVGKNMVRSIRFWSHAAGVVADSDRGKKPTNAGVANKLLDDALAGQEKENETAGPGPVSLGNFNRSRRKCASRNLRERRERQIPS